MEWSRFVFADSWHVPGASCAQVQSVVTDLGLYPVWWPQMRAVARIDDDRARVLVRSRLPVMLDLELTAVSRDLPTLEVAMDGDLVGSVRWTLSEESDGVRIDLVQDVQVAGWQRWVAGLARPVLRWNHEQAMADGRTGLLDRISDV